MPQQVKMKGFGTTKSVPAPGPVSKVGDTGAAPRPNGRLKNTRDYAKPAPPIAAKPLDATPSPFGPTDGGSRIGGI